MSKLTKEDLADIDELIDDLEDQFLLELIELFGLEKPDLSKLDKDVEMALYDAYQAMKKAGMLFVEKYRK